jgi:hypothetical protein
MMNQQRTGLSTSIPSARFLPDFPTLAEKRERDFAIQVVSNIRLATILLML